jgi:hypothetical protein
MAGTSGMGWRRFRNTLIVHLSDPACVDGGKLRRPAVRAARYVRGGDGYPSPPRQGRSTSLSMSSW